MGKEIINGLGKIDISEEVISAIAGATAVECYGLVGMASRKITDGFADLLGRENLVQLTFLEPAAGHAQQAHWA